MKITREWAMPNKNTFLIRPIKSFLKKAMYEHPGIYADPFCGYCSPANIKNDLNPDIPADFHFESQEFANVLKADSFTHIIFDPPYSPRQLKECYEGIGLEVTKKNCQDVPRFSKTKDILSKKMNTDSIVISFGWSSTGFGEKRGFELIEILLINHGSAHNDTLCLLEKKIEAPACHLLRAP